MAMLALELQRKQQLRQDIVVTTTMSNSGLEDFLRRHMIQVLTTRNGDKYVTSALTCAGI